MADYDPREPHEPQLIRDRAGRPLFAILPFDEYELLRQAAEDSADIAAAEATRGEETVPAELVHRIVAGENRVRVWRRHRGLTQAALAARAGITQAYLSEIETGKSEGSVKVLAALAHALAIDLDDLVPPPPEAAAD